MRVSRQRVADLRRARDGRLPGNRVDDRGPVDGHGIGRRALVNAVTHLEGEAGIAGAVGVGRRRVGELPGVELGSCWKRCWIGPRSPPMARRSATWRWPTSAPAGWRCRSAAHFCSSSTCATAPTRCAISCRARASGASPSPAACARGAPVPRAGAVQAARRHRLALAPGPVLLSVRRHLHHGPVDAAGGLLAGHGAAALRGRVPQVRQTGGHVDQRSWPPGSATTRCVCSCSSWCGRRTRRATTSAWRRSCGWPTRPASR